MDCAFAVSEFSFCLREDAEGRLGIATFELIPSKTCSKMLQSKDAVVLCYSRLNISLNILNLDLDPHV